MKRQPYESCEMKQNKILELFSLCKTPEEKYIKIIELGKSLPPLQAEDKKEENKVSGCQSSLYLKASLTNGLIYFAIDSEALISAGLAALLLAVYNGEPPEVVLKCPPLFLDKLNINASLSPSRANGLYHIHLRMKQEALKFLLA